MKKLLSNKWLFLILQIIGTLLIVFLILNVYLYIYKNFSPKFENVRREVFQNTKSYNEGKIQDLAKYRLEYLTSNDKEKEALRSTILIMYSDYPKDRLPSKLQAFLFTLENKLKGEN